MEEDITDAEQEVTDDKGEQKEEVSGSRGRKYDSVYTDQKYWMKYENQEKEAIINS